MKIQKMSVLTSFLLIPELIEACGLGAFNIGMGGLDPDSAVYLAVVGLVVQSMYLWVLKEGERLAVKSQPGTPKRWLAGAVFVPNCLVWVIFGWGYLGVIVPVVLYETMGGKWIWLNLPLIVLIPMIWVHSKKIAATFRVFFPKKEVQTD